MAARVHRESALRVSDCVTELLRKQPFFGSLVLRLPLRPDPTRETLATDGHDIRYSPPLGVVAPGAGRGFVGDGDVVARLAVVEPAGPGGDVQAHQHGVAVEVHRVLLSG